MTNAEMNRRLDTISEDRLVQARRLYREGNGGQTIKIETGLTLKQVNAVCQQYDEGNEASRKALAKLAPMDGVALYRANID